MALNHDYYYRKTSSDTQNLTAISGGKCRVNFESIALAENPETDDILFYWRVYITTPEDKYITSNRNHTITFKPYTHKTKVGYYYYPEQTFTVRLNTDINDEVELACGILEVDYGAVDLYWRFDCDFTGATEVNVSGASGTGLNTYTLSANSTTNTYYGGMWTVDKLLNADNFNDDGNLRITYDSVKTSDNKYKCHTYICFDGYTHSGIERDLTNYVETTGSYSYSYNFTEAEREIIRKGIPNAKSREVFIFLYSQITTNSTGSPWTIHYLKRTMSIVNGEPTFNPVIEDTNTATIALTGNKNKLVRYHSNAYVVSNVALTKHAGSLVSHKITFGNQSTTAQKITFKAVEGNKFVFSATDSRGYSKTQTYNSPFVDYVKLTCYMEYGVVEADTGKLAFSVKGNYYNGGFGAVNNTLTLTYRIKENEGAWGSWTAINSTTYEENTYTAKVNLTGLNYQSTYQLQAKAVDKLNTVESVIYTLKTVPVFDWSETDFNFNVPVNFSDTADFDKATTFNSGATFKGTVNLGNATVSGLKVNTSNATFDGNKMVDYIVATGTSEMGSNGVWKWQKWASGKAEAWGKRNYGNMGFSTVYYGNLYRSETFTQALPSIFNAEPDVIDINIIKSNAPAFVLRGIDTYSSASSTGGFAICRMGTTSMSAVHLGFHIVGTWK